MDLLVFAVVLVSTAVPVLGVVEVIWEEPTATSPEGHSAIRIDGKVYDAKKDIIGIVTGKATIRERDWVEEVLNDERGQLTVRLPLTYEQEQQLKKNMEGQVNSKIDFDLILLNCADWVEGELREIGVNLPNEYHDHPAETLYQASTWASQQSQN